MRILFLTTRLPSTIGGERLRPFYFLKYFPGEWEIRLLSFVESASDKEAVKGLSLPNLTIRTVSLSKYKSYMQCLRGAFGSMPLQAAYYASPQMHKLVQEELSSLKYDVIFCHLLRMAPYALNCTGPKKVLDFVDAFSLRYALSVKFRKGAFKFVEWLESGRLKGYEPWVSRQFDLNLVASSADKIYLEKLGVHRLEVIENGADLDNQVSPDNSRHDPYKIVFFANLRAFHNIDAVLYFYKKIFPLVKERIKEAKFVIVGTNFPQCIIEIKKDKSVDILADVGDIQPCILDACVAVAPMRVAVGIQNKILQSMALRLPVVTTGRGLGGIQAKPDRDILVADKPEEFADKVIRLMQNKPLRKQITENAYRLIQEKYLWPEIVKDLSDKLLGLLEKTNV